MDSHAVADSEEIPIESSILTEIKEFEKKADEILERANKQKDSIIYDSVVNSSKLLSAKEEEIKKLQEKKTMEFKDKSKLIIDEKIAEGKIAAKQMKAKSEKNMPKAVEFVMKKFEETM